MSRVRAAEAGGACVICRRRSWLLSALSPSLDYCARDRDRLTALLSLDDRALVQALGGRRRKELSAQLDDFGAPESIKPPIAEALCIHSSFYPAALSATPWPPRTLHVDGGADRLAELVRAPVVAVVGSRRASGYGVEMARCVARGLAASGVSVVSAMSDGIAAAALGGALDTGAPALGVLGAGLGVRVPAWRRPLLACLVRSGCAVSELAHDCPGRRWGEVAAERIIAGLADVVLVIEAEDRPGDLAIAALAQALGRTVAGTPGRLTSPLSTGAHRLLREGATLVTGAEDVLELLHSAPRVRSAPLDSHPDPAAPRAELDPRLVEVLRQVGSGRDTPDALAQAGIDPDEMLLALSELELLGHLRRGGDGRYLPRQPFT